VQFTDYGLSGICVFDLSRSYGPACRAVAIDFAPGHAEEEIVDLLAAGRAAGLSGVVHPKVAKYMEGFVGRLGVDADAAPTDADGVVTARRRVAPFEADTGGMTQARRLASAVKRFVVPVKGTRGWKDAQITVGGVAMDEVSEKYFEVKSIPGLYFVGEALDLDGPSGGYNLDIAWNTGLKAGRAAGAYCASYLQTP
jgi:predicted flavoprotein YhiN